jgi:hypothetical protein
MLEQIFDTQSAEFAMCRQALITRGGFMGLSAMGPAYIKGPITVTRDVLPWIGSQVHTATHYLRWDDKY